MARFLIDAQLPPALARRLTALGHVAEHVDDAGLASASDRRIWDYALNHSAVIVTRDEDFPLRKGLEAQAPSLSGFASAIPASRYCWNGSRLCYPK
jgi:predicted nuclease of predicted toxin-antitoxin system